MSNSTKAILIFLVVVLLLIGIWYLVAGKSQPAPAQNPVVTQSQTEAGQAPTTSAAGSSVSARDNSDASLSADLTSIDAQLKVVDTNSASVDQSLNDKPVAQTE
jgi:cytoskeletal protein RodZ